MATKKKIKNKQLKEYVYSSSSDIHGTGLFAKQPIKKGTYIGTYHGPRAKKNGTYVLWVYDHDDEESAIGCDGKNLLRYLNHAEPGNAEFDELDLYARINIKAGDEITFNYEPD